MKKDKRFGQSIRRLTAIAMTAAMLQGVVCMPVTVAAAKVTDQKVEIQAVKHELSDSWQQKKEYSGMKTEDEVSGFLRFTGFQNQGKLYVTVSKETKKFLLSINGTQIDTSQMIEGKDKTYVIDYSDLAINGANIVCVTQLKPTKAKVTVEVPYPEVIEGDPEEVGMDKDTIALIDDLVNSEIEYGFSAAQLAVIKDGKMVVNKAWGNVTGWTSDGIMDKSSAKVTTDTLFDLASNSKMYTVNYAIQKLVTEGKLDLDEKVNTYLPEFQDTDQDTIKGKNLITVRNVLKHQAGFPSTWKYYNPELAQNLFCQNREEMLDKICHTPLEYKTGTKTIYSDLDYMLLCLLVEKITGQGFDVYLNDTFYKPLGLTHTTFQPLLHGFRADQCAATELNGNTRDGVVNFVNIRKKLVQGEVHDEKAYYSMGGISGHAGLFSNASELAKLCQVMINGGGYGEYGFFSADVIDEFTKGKGYDSSTSAWGLGWWREADHSTRLYYFGPQSSSDTYGHQGWTGTLSVIDPENNLVIVFLTNKKNSPVIDNKAAQNDFVCDNYALGSLGIISGYVYEALNTDNDAALDANAYTTALERVKQFSGRLGTYDTAVHMTDSYAMVDWLVSRAEYRKTDTCKDYAQKLLNEVNEIVDANRTNGKISDHILTLADSYKQSLQKQIDALSTKPATDKVTRLKTRKVAALATDTGAQQVLKFPSILGTPSNSKLFGGNLYSFEADPSNAVLYASVTTEENKDMRLFLNGTEVDLTELKQNPGTAYAIDFSELCNPGQNTIQVSGIRRDVAAGEGITVYLNYPTVSEKLQANTIDLDTLEAQILKDVGNQYSAQLAIISDGEIVKNKAYGKNADVKKEYCLQDATDALSSLFMVEKALSDELITVDTNQNITLAELTKLAETATSTSMPDYVQKNIYQKMGLDQIHFVNEAENCVYLYSNAECLAKLGQLVLNGGGYGNQMIYQKNIGDYFNAIADNNPKSSFCWMRQGNLQNTYLFGNLASRKTIGCFNEEGSFLVVDPEQNLVIAYTTNVPASNMTITPAQVNTLIYKALMLSAKEMGNSKAA